jgi:tRNA dimethylallyltransferase
MITKPPIIFLMGPTASGKTPLSLELAQCLPVEIISVDSAMVYKGMDIGTAKPEKSILTAIPHHLLDICDPSESYSAGRFCREVLIAINTIIAKGKIPLLVGGTMLYFKSLQQGLATLPNANEVIRNNLQQRALLVGWPQLHSELQAIDPTAASKIHPNDAQRIQRAHEVYQLSGKPISNWCLQDTLPLEHYHIIALALLPKQRELLHARIANRLKIMLSQGFIEEVKYFFQRGDLSLQLPAMRAVGYRQIWEYFLGNYDEQEMSQKILFATRQLAKRQITWLRAWPHLACFSIEQKNLYTWVKDHIHGQMYG